VAEHVSNMGVESMQYFVLDHLGSTVALTDNSGNTLERNAYDPYGKRRTLTGGTDTGCTLTDFGDFPDQFNNFGPRNSGSMSGGGISGNAGLNVPGSNARSVDSVQGAFGNQSPSAGDGLSGGVDALEGTGAAAGQKVAGGGATVGPRGGMQRWRRGYRRSPSP